RSNEGSRSPPQVTIETTEPDAPSPEELARANVARLREAWKANPEDARTCNALAWELVAGPPSARRPEEAVELAEKAVGLGPENANWRNTLGVAYYRAGRYREAADCLTANLSKQSDASLEYDLYFLAMSQYHLGNKDSARGYLRLANRWLDSQTTNVDEKLTAFRTEAERLIRDDEAQSRSDDKSQSRSDGI
ncbi:MAG TPA: tetratricopeptide repeat protein, partial [Pirellulaceae bacterium]